MFGINFEYYHYKEREMAMLTVTLPFSLSGLWFRLYQNLDITHQILAKPIRSLGSMCYVVSLPFCASWSSLSSSKHKQRLALQHVHSILHSSAFALLHLSYWAQTAGSNQAYIFGAWPQVMLRATVGLGWPGSEPVPRPAKACSKLN